MSSTHENPRLADAPARSRHDRIRNTLVGRSMFLVGLAVWIWLSLDLVPYASYKSQWLFSLEWGMWGSREWLHPLYVPVMGGLRLILGVFGYSGPMLVPAEVMNLGVGGATLAGLFLLTERLGRDSPIAALAVWCLGFDTTFWQFVLPADPYALASACSVAAVVLLIVDRPVDARWRYALAGCAVSLTIGFSAAGVALLPLAGCAAWREAGSTSRRARLVGWFLGTASVTIALVYAIFVVHKGIGTEYLTFSLFVDVFHGGKEAGGTIYETMNIWTQVTGFFETVNQGFVALALLYLGLALFLRRRRVLPPLDARQRFAGTVLIASVAFYSAFFIINDNTNGFICAVVLPLPPLLAMAVSQHKWMRIAYIVMASHSVAVTAAAGLYSPEREDFVFREARFLDDILEKGDILVLSGCPFIEMLYERHFNVLRTIEVDEPQYPCFVPLTRPEALTHRIQDVLARGRNVFVQADAPAAYRALNSGDLMGFGQHGRQLFESAEIEPVEVADSIRELRRGLERSFRVRCGILSPQGWEYCRVEARPGESPPDGPWDSAAEDCGALPLVVEPGVDIESLLPTERYLTQWVIESPEDTCARDDLRALLTAEPTSVE